MDGYLKYLQGISAVPRAVFLPVFPHSNQRRTWVLRYSFQFAH
jgi:hypothetical protein